tara:strand:- start:1038 stop:1493 length:456 start_codon:yes stop_codon:yes gene_type:complete
MSTTQMSFAEKMRSTSDLKKEEIEAMISQKLEERQSKEKERIHEVREKLFTTLTEKYHKLIARGINNAAVKGKREKYINFTRDDFKANCKGVGFPQEVQAAWLNEMCNPESKFLPVAEEDDNWWTKGDKMDFNGVEFKVWNNKVFTVVFTW